MINAVKICRRPRIKSPPSRKRAHALNKSVRKPCCSDNDIIVMSIVIDRLENAFVFRPSGVNLVTFPTHMQSPSSPFFTPAFALTCPSVLFVHTHWSSRFFHRYNQWRTLHRLTYRPHMRAVHCTVVQPLEARRDLNERVHPMTSGSVKNT